MTNDAGYTLVTGVRQNGITYIAVVMRGADMNEVSMDSRLLYDYGFQNFQKTEYRTGNVIIPRGTGTESVTVREEEINGRKMEGYYLADHRIGIGKAAQATATPTPQIEEAEDANEAPLYGQTENSDTTQEPARDGITNLAKFLFIVMGVMVVILVILLIALAKKNKKAKKKRK